MVNGLVVNRRAASIADKGAQCVMRLLTGGVGPRRCSGVL